MKYPLFSCYLLTFFLTHTPVSALPWPDECEVFAASKLKVLRETRPHLKRPNVPFSQACEVVDFIERGTKTYGTKTLAESSHFTDLMVDVCDIVNLQHPDFKTRYDIFVEQREGGKQFPFSLFTFDRIAQAFHYQQTLFNTSSGSAYRLTLEEIIEKELPLLSHAFHLIRDLNAEKEGIIFSDQNYYIYLKGINDSLDAVLLTSGKTKAAAEKTIRSQITSPRMKFLCSLSSMAHDYLTLSRLEESIDVTSHIPAFQKAEEREAFLAGMIQIGELTTNKNLSTFVQLYMPTIPWEGLVHCRDAIEHQDEHGFNIYFASLVDGSNTSVRFQEWQRELKILNKRIVDAKQLLWKNDPQATFEFWLNAELAGNSVYGVIPHLQSAPISKHAKKIFRQTPLFKGNSSVWGKLINGTHQITYTHFQLLRAEIERLRTLIPTLAEGTDKKKNIEYLDSYEVVGDYLWDRLKNEAVHLTSHEQSLLVDTAKGHFINDDISKMCLALLNKDQSFLTKENNNRFAQAASSASLNMKPICFIITQFQPEMLVTRQVWTALPYDKSKDLAQVPRKELAKSMFERTSHHLHTLAHGPKFEERMIQEMYTIPTRFAFQKASERDPKVKALEERIEQLHQTHAIEDEYGYRNLTPEGEKLAQLEILKSGVKINYEAPTPEGKKYGEEVMDLFFHQAHKVHLPTGIKRDPTSYLASVYTLSVGIGALKEWVKRENSPPIIEVDAVEALREGRNFIAHGDLFRNMHSVQLSDIQENLLTNHLNHCAKLRFTGSKRKK